MSLLGLGSQKSMFMPVVAYHLVIPQEVNILINNPIITIVYIFAIAIIVSGAPVAASEIGFHGDPSRIGPIGLILR